MSVIEFDERMSQKVEAVYLSPEVVAQRRQVLQALNLAPGEHVLDIGSGPGLLAYDIAAAVGPRGRVSGIDASPAMIGMSAKRCLSQSWAAMCVATIQESEC